MAKEIERKFLVASDAWRSEADEGEEIVQGYLSEYPQPTVRVRLRGHRGYLTVKGANCGAVRDEWEYEIPESDARGMLELCPANCVLAKRRYRLGRWEIDVFEGRHKGLVLAEIELTSADEVVALPSWVGREVTGDARYYNSSLAAGK